MDVHFKIIETWIDLQWLRSADSIVQWALAILLDPINFRSRRIAASAHSTVKSAERSHFGRHGS